MSSIKNSNRSEGKKQFGDFVRKLKDDVHRASDLAYGHEKWHTDRDGHRHIERALKTGKAARKEADKIISDLERQHKEMR